MEKVYDNCCGIDVHKKLIVACFKKGNKQEIRDCENRYFPFKIGEYFRENSSSDLCCLILADLISIADIFAFSTMRKSIS